MKYEKRMENLKILFLGDLVGRPGRFGVSNFLGRSGNNYDFIIANVENASHGFGLTEKNYKDLSEMGINAMTSGNHIWDKKEILNYIDTADRLVRPLNYTEDTPGQGSRIFKTEKGHSIGIINIQGTVFMSPINPPWEMLEKEIKKIKETTNVVLIDFHAEATAEKVSCGYIADALFATAMIGTHTHVQTADEKILENGTAYITDIGFCGAYKSVIGMNVEDSVSKLVKSLPVKLDVAPADKVQVNGVELEVDASTGRALNIKRIIDVFSIN